MRSPVPEYLEAVLNACTDESPGAIALTTVDDSHHGAGDLEHRFTIQSMSKAFAYALAIEELGWDAVHEKIDVEPSGEGFNDISLDSETGRPHNAMINAGAIATAGLIGSADRVIEFLSKLAGRDLEIDQETYESEKQDAHRNLALAHLLAAYEIIDDPAEAVDHYLRQCALSVDVRDLATMASVLANGGVHPDSGERLMKEGTARQVLSVMATCGMYDDAGDWLSSVGIPAKSGVSGGIIGVLPGQVGVAVFSPGLDDHGTSRAGAEMMRRLSEDMGLHLMNPGRPSRSALADVQVADEESTYVLAGDLLFASAESLFRHLLAKPPETTTVVLDISRVGEISEVGRTMALEAKSRLEEEGFTVRVVDSGDDDRLGQAAG